MPPKRKVSTKNIIFWHIFKIKWPKSEENLEFGGRLGWGPDHVAGPIVWLHDDLLKNTICKNNRSSITVQLKGFVDWVPSNATGCDESYN